jgi:hypothetical protein
MVEQMKPPFKVESHYKPKLRDDTPDDEWLSLVGENGWTVISHDCRFHKESPALEAIKQFKIKCFYLWGAQVPVWTRLAY